MRKRVMNRIGYSPAQRQLQAGAPKSKFNQLVRRKQPNERSSNPMMGECALCHASFPKAQATRHVTACLKARAPESGQRVKALHLRVEGKYNPEYWMHFEIASAMTLYTWTISCGGPGWSVVAI